MSRMPRVGKTNILRHALRDGAVIREKYDDSPVSYRPGIKGGYPWVDERGYRYTSQEVYTSSGN